MNRKPTNNRRKLLSTVAATATASVVVSKQWVKPIIESVVLPAHAKTSNEVIISCSGCYVFGSTNSILFDEDTNSFEFFSGNTVCNGAPIGAPAPAVVAATLIEAQLTVPGANISVGSLPCIVWFED